MNDFVLKPVVSGAGRHTYKINQTSISEYESLFSSLIKEEAMMIQEFQYNVPKFGEISMMFFGGKYSHAVLKRAKQGEFRVQDDFGGTVHDYKASSEEIDFARFTIEQINPIPIYARIDIFRDNENKLALAEIELVEPELWFRNKPEAADMLAAEVFKLL
jgi:glutathione synthase/RimK-type ligase-like ATP-grasp enzyme